MNVQSLIALLRQSGADAWEMTVQTRQSWEFYFIGHRLDQNRALNVEHRHVRLYRRSGDGFIGSAGGEIPPSATPEEAKAAIAGYLRSAAGVRNPDYSLQPKGEPDDACEPLPSLAQMASDFIRLMQHLPETENESVNSYEIFTGHVTTRYVNSEGVDRMRTAPQSMLEVVLNAREGAREIELYRKMHLGLCDPESLRRRLSDALSYGKLKLAAQPTPALGRADVLFSGEAAATLFDFFADRLSADYKVRGYSDWEIGQPIAECSGDRVTLTALRALPNSSKNAAFDAEGAPVRDTVLLEDGVPRHFLGTRQFSQYMGLSDSFIPGNLAVSGGTHAEADLRKGPTLEVLEFSDFQVNPMNGDIAGEIRLALWHDGEKTLPVSGGSLSGSMMDYMRQMRMTEATEQLDDRLIPVLTRIDGIRVTGAESTLA